MTQGFDVDWREEQIVEQMGLFSQCQRWDHKRSSFRPSGETVSVGQYNCSPISDAVAKVFIATHHYSGTLPATVLNIGLFRKKPFEAEKLVGVACFSVPCNGRVVPKYTGLEPGQGVELGRFVLLSEEPANTESYFLGQCFKLLSIHKPHIQGVVSYSDPVPRTTSEGEVIKPGHIGQIYMAHNGRFVGRSSKRTLLLTDSGTVISERTLSKIRKMESGWQYAEKQLVDAGVSWRSLSEHPSDWLNRILSSSYTPLRRLRHPGNYCYAWPLGSSRKKKLIEKDFAPSLPYPKNIAA